MFLQNSSKNILALPNDSHPQTQCKSPNEHLKLIEVFISKHPNEPWIETFKSKFISTSNAILTKKDSVSPNQALIKIKQCWKQILFPSQAIDISKTSESHNSKLSLNLAVSLILLQKPNTPDTLTQKCLEFISETTKQSVYLDENGVLRITIEKRNLETAKLFKCISSQRE